MKKTKEKDKQHEYYKRYYETNKKTSYITTK